MLSELRALCVRSAQERTRCGRNTRIPPALLYNLTETSSRKQRCGSTRLKMDDENWRRTLEDALSAAVSSAVQARAADPIRYVATQLLLMGSPVAAAAASGTPMHSPVTGEWTLSTWLQSLPLEAAVVTALSPRGFEEVASLTPDGIVELLRPYQLAGLAATVRDGVKLLQEQSAATGSALNAKFVAEEGTYEMSFGGLDKFWAGLEGLVGPPRMLGGSLLSAMAAEHCDAADSDTPFTTPNGFEGATSRREWEWVVAPKMGGSYVERADIRAHNPTCSRQPIQLREYEVRMESINVRLRGEGHTEMTAVELVGGRLYTAAMYYKYNAVLRGCGHNERLRQIRDALTAGNLYPTTIHAINSLIIKLSKLTPACTVWRGFTKATLPKKFWEPNADGFCGGVEYGFCSTTVDRAQAAYYSQGTASTILEMKLGMLDRGADISWLSAYPHEKEILFPPLLGQQVCETRVERQTLVVETRLSLNMAALTMEQVVSKRRKILLDMSDNVGIEVKNDLSKRGLAHLGKRCMASGVEPIVGVRYEKGHESRCLCEAEYLRLPDADRARCTAVPAWGAVPSEIDARAALATALLRNGLALGHSPDWFNDEDANFSAAVNDALAIRRGLCDSPVKLELRDCTTLPELPDEVGACAAVRTLYVVNAPSLTRLSELTFSPSIVTVDLHKCPALQALPSSLGQSGSLATLRIKRCSALEALPVLSGCGSLQTLSVSYCTALTSLPPSLAACTQLESLELTGCSALEHVPSLSMLPHLTELTLAGCRNLLALPDALGTSLRSITLRDCGQLSALPTTLGLCSLLEALDCSDCVHLLELPPSVGSCSSLNSLTLMSCTSLQTLPETIGGCTRLHYLNLGGCTALRSLPGDLGACRALEDLTLHGCSALALLPDRLGDCIALRALELDGCTELASLPDLSSISGLDRSKLPRALVEGGAVARSGRQRAQQQQQHYTQST